jgi:hypothetical protein
MQSLDPTTNKSRGFVLLSFERDEIYCSPHFPFPQSILFRSKRSQNPARLGFKTFLNQYEEENVQSLQFRHVVQYWTDDGKNSDKVWSILEPALIPIKEEGLDRVKRVLSATRALLDKVNIDSIQDTRRDDLMNSDFVKCSRNLRTIKITAMEVIALIYVSTLEASEISNVLNDIDFGKEDDSSESVVAHLKSEIELIQRAIRMSDDECLCGPQDVMNG